MKIAIDTFSYYMNFGRHWYVPECPVDIRWYCEKAKMLGADGLHIDPYHIDLDNDTDWVLDFAEKNNMYIELGACGTSLEELSTSIEAAEKLGAGLLRTFVGGNCLDGKESAVKRTEIAKKQLSEVIPYAKKHHVKIAIENHGDLYIENIVNLLEIESDYLGICFDSGNFAFTGEDPLKGLITFKDRILCTHLKDVCAKEVYPGAKPFTTMSKPVHFCALGDGYLPIPAIISEVLKQGINNLTLEICSPCDKTIKERQLLAFEENNVKKSISYLRRLI